MENPNAHDQGRHSNQCHRAMALVNFLVSKSLKKSRKSYIEIRGLYLMKLSNKMLQKPDFWQKELVKSLENLVFFLVSKWHWLIPTPIGALAHDPKMEIEFAKIKWRQWNFTPIYRAAKNGHLVIIK